jgi:hypothetical protein
MTNGATRQAVRRGPSPGDRHRADAAHTVDKTSQPEPDHEVAQLQHVVGNQVVAQLLADGPLDAARQTAPLQRNGNVSQLVKKFEKAAAATGPAKAATKKPFAESMAELQASKAPLTRILTVAFADYTPTLADLKPYIDAAKQDERDAAWGSASLMATAKSKLSNDDYLALLPALRMFKKGTTAEDNKSHTKADDADKYIRDQLAAYVTEAVKAGRQVAGQVAVVDGKDWEAAYDREFGNDGEEASTNAFVDRKGIIWIHKDRGNAGTAIHEGVHKYAPDTLLTDAGFNFNEGITEYFTRKICSGLKNPIARGNYESNYLFAKKFVEVAGEQTVASAYFDGKLADLKKVIADKGLNWTTIVTKVKQDKWAEAVTALSAPAPVVGGPTK